MMKRFKIRYRHRGTNVFHVREVTHVWWSGGELCFRDASIDGKPYVVEHPGYWTLLINYEDFDYAETETVEKNPG